MVDEPRLIDVPVVPDIPIPEPEEELSNPDSFEGALRLAIIGVGQAGGRIAQQFSELGYGRVCAINTALQDLGNLKLKDHQKLLIGAGGAGKIPDLARSQAIEASADIYDLMQRNFGADFDRILVCAGAGGGTGCGALPVVLDIAHDLMETLGIELELGNLSARLTCKVGALIALPKNMEGAGPARNAWHLLNDIRKRVKFHQVSPVILIDNEKICKLYPKVSVSQLWDVANRTITSIFHLFNTISCVKSSNTSFDTADLETILNSGITSFGAIEISKFDELSDVAVAVRKNLERNILVSGLTQGTI